MNNDERTKLLKYIERSATHAYEYSENDCMTFPMGWHDERFGTKTTDAIRGKYHTAIGAKKFYKNFVSVTGWLRNQGYKRAEQLADGDFVVAENNGWPAVYIAFEGHLYFLDESRLLKLPVQLVQFDSIWRK